MFLQKIRITLGCEVSGVAGTISEEEVCVWQIAYYLAGA